MTFEAQLRGILGWSARRRVLLGCAPANLLRRISFADVLDQNTGCGYQRRFNRQHSLDFRKYIQRPHSSTIPLTFNLRGQADTDWQLRELKNGTARLSIRAGESRVLAQVDCQHRLGCLGDLPILLPFMAFLGLSQREEMEVFSIINGKARGLSTSLLDFHDASLADDLAAERPELFIALHLNHDAESPWYRTLDLGGNSTSGLLRRASLRTMQKAVKRFLRQTKIATKLSSQEAARIVLDFWIAVSKLLPNEWGHPRRHLINKGVGVYSLMTMAGDLYREAEATGLPCTRQFLTDRLAEFLARIDWSNKGELAGLGGESGVGAAVTLLRLARAKRKLKVVSRG
jgi:DGQHR domain-containing protein